MVQRPEGLDLLHGAFDLGADFGCPDNVSSARCEPRLRYHRQLFSQYYVPRRVRAQISEGLFAHFE